MEDDDNDRYIHKNKNMHSSEEEEEEEEIEQEGQEEGDNGKQASEQPTKQWQKCASTAQSSATTFEQLRNKGALTTE